MCVSVEGKIQALHEAVELHQPVSHVYIHYFWMNFFNQIEVQSIRLF